MIECSRCLGSPSLHSQRLPVGHGAGHAVGPAGRARRQVPVSSAGLLAGDRKTAAGGDLCHGRPGHRRQPPCSRTVTADDLAAADLILGLAREHVRHAAVLLPAAWPRAFTLRELVRRGRQAGPRAPGEPLGYWLTRAADGRDRPASSAAARPTTWPTRRAARCPRTRRPRTCSTSSPATSSSWGGRAAGRRQSRPGPFGIKIFKSFLRTDPGSTAIRQAPSITVACTPPAESGPGRRLSGGALGQRRRRSSAGPSRASRVSSSGSSGLTWACLTSG